MRRTVIATALAALMGVGLVMAGGKPGNAPGYDDIGYGGDKYAPTFNYSKGGDPYTKGGSDPSAFGTDNWGSYMGDQYGQTDQYGQYGQYGNYDQYGQTDQYGQYDQYGQTDQYGQYDQFGGRPGNSYPSDPNYDFGGRHPYYAPEKRGFFDYDFGRRFMVGTAGDAGGYVMRDAVSGNLTGERALGGVAAGGIENFADYAGNYDRRNDAGARIASNAVGYGLGNVAYRGISGDKIQGKHVAGGIVEGGVVGFGKYMGDEEPTAMNGLFWGGLTRFGGAMANRGISGDRMRGKDIAGEGLRSVIGALGYMGGNEQ